MRALQFSDANNKTKKLYKVKSLEKWLARRIQRRKAKVYGFSLLSGHDCPFAKLCQSKAIMGRNLKRTIEDGKDTKFRCFSAQQEAQYDDVYLHRLANHMVMHSLKDRWAMADAIEKAIPEDAGIIRIHIAGDFFSNEYFMAWVIVASRKPEVLFYAYTKSLQYWVRNRDYLPGNLVLTASRGGRSDQLIKKYNLREARVVFSEAEAVKYGLEIDDNDSTACDPAKASQSFALLLHGSQPAGTPAAKALSKLMKEKKVKQIELTTADAAV